jgi:hypothetical protein
VHKDFQSRPGSTERAIHSVPRRLSANQKTVRVDVSSQPLSLLERREIRARRDIITLDESWFDLSTDYGLIWLAPGAILPARERPMTHPPKFMVMVAWNLSGSHVLNARPNGTKYNAIAIRSRP